MRVDRVPNYRTVEIELCDDELHSFIIDEGSAVIVVDGSELALKRGFIKALAGHLGADELGVILDEMAEECVCDALERSIHRDLLADQDEIEPTLDIADLDVNLGILEGVGRYLGKLTESQLIIVLGSIEDDDLLGALRAGGRTEIWKAEGEP